MINAPQTIIDSLISGNLSVANFITVNLGDAYDTGSDEILYLTDWPHDLPFDGNTYLSDHHLTSISGITRKAETGSDKVDIEFSITDSTIISAIKSERYINKPTSISRGIIENGQVKDNFIIPIRTGFGLSHGFTGDLSDRSVILTIDSVLGDLDSDNGWYAINASHEQRYPGDKIMQHGPTVFTDEQRKKYTNNFKGVINQEIKPPALSKIYGYKNVELVPLMRLEHRKTHSSYRHYFTTFIYCINIGECESVDIQNLKKDDEDFDYNIVSDTDPEYGGWSVRIRTPSENTISCQTDPKLEFWRQRLDTAETARLTGMFGRGLTLLFVVNRNRDDWIKTAPVFTLPVQGSKVFDPRSGLTVYSRNPGLQYADFLRSADYGAGKRSLNLTDANIIELANHFDAIPGSTGNPGINSIKIDVQVDTGEPIVDNMNIWIKGVRLFTSDYYGQFNLRVETISAKVWDFDENDLEDFPELDSGDFTEKLTQLTYSIKQLVPDTTEGALPGDLVEVDVESTFPEDGSAIFNTWLAENGGIDNFDSKSLSYVTELEQAFYWTMVDARISRKPAKLTLPVGEIGWLMEVGDVIGFTSEELDEDDSLWRVQEVNEDDEDTKLELTAYSDTFYTPDPNSIPAPPAPAQPPTDAILTAVAGLNIIYDKGNYYLTWTALVNSNVSWYAIEIENTANPGTLVYDEPKIAQPPLLLSNIVVGDYQATIVPFSQGTEGNTPSTLLFSIAIPEAPTIQTVPGALEITIIPRTSQITIGQLYELEFNIVNNQSTATNYGLSGSFTVTGLASNTIHYFWVRAVNPIGESIWVNGFVSTTNDATVYVDLIGTDIAAQILPDVITGVQYYLDTLVDNRLVDYSTTVQVNTLISDALDIAGLEDNEDQRINIVEQVNSVFDTNERSSEIKQTNINLLSETESRTVQVNQITARIDGVDASIITVQQSVVDESSARAALGVSLTAADNAQIARLDVVESDIAGNNIAISSIEGSVNNPSTGLTATYNQLQQVEITAINTASSVSIIQNTVNNPTSGLSATFTIAGQAQSTANSALSATGTLNTAVSNAQTSANSALTLSSNIDDSLDIFRASAMLAVAVNGNTSFIQLDATPTVTQAKIQAGQVIFVDSTSTPRIYFDLIKLKYIFDGELQAVTGTFIGDISGATGSFSGSVEAGNIIGDTAAGATKVLSSQLFSAGSSNAKTVVSGTVSAQNYARIVVLPSPLFQASTPGTVGSVVIRWYKNNSLIYSDSTAIGSYRFSSVPASFSLVANETADFKVDVQYSSGGQTDLFSQAYEVKVFRQSNQITFD